MKRAAAKKRPKQIRSGGGFIGRLGGALPEPSAQARARVAAWLAGVEPKSAGNDIEALVRRHPALGQILGGAAEAAMSGNGQKRLDLVNLHGARLRRNPAAVAIVA